MSIFITGDTHIPIDIHKLSMKNWGEQRTLTKDDILIICGDFGGVWDGSHEEMFWLSWLNNKPFTTCFVCGNHENFEKLDTMKTEIWNGGKIHRVMPSVIHLMRGQVFNICGSKIFTMGGAASHDKEFRVEGKSWWSREMPSNKEYEEALFNLNKHNWNVDFVITHCAPSSIQEQINRDFERDRLTEFLETIEMDLEYKNWFFGHYHVDCKLVGGTGVYIDIIKIK